MNNENELGFNMGFRLNFAVLSIVFLIFSIIIQFDKSYAQFEFSGYMFGDYYYVVKNHKEDLEGRNGFWYRRIYLTADRDLDDEFSVRLRMEFNSPGDFESKDKMSPIAKDAYISWKRNSHSIIFGLSPTPNFSLIEKVWGYRSVEMTPLDLQKFASSRDFGITFKGTVGKSKKVSYNLMFANGNGTSSEIDKGKSVLFSFSAKNAAGWIAEGYVDWNDRPGGNRWYTLQGFLGFQGKSFRTGFQFARQTRRDGASGEDDNLEIASIFAAGKLSTSVSVFARFDRNFDPNPSGAKISYIPFDPTACSNFIVAGLDFLIAKDVHIIPNAEIVLYDENDSGTKPDTDLIPRITAYFRF